jgi:exodeoxyribonuclease V alpha subunit
MGYTHIRPEQYLRDYPELERIVGGARSWLEQLQRCRIVGTEDATEPMPLVATDDGRVYLHRYRQAERQLRQQVVTRCRMRQDFPDLDQKELKAVVSAGLDSQDSPPDAHGALGIWLALTRGFSVITGGPGTGKTTLVSRLLRILRRAAPETLDRTVVAAPTGKAAMRLRESLHSLNAAEDAPGSLPTVEPVTLHRLLGANRRGEFRHGPGHPLRARCVIVDEASMIDLMLLNHLLLSVRPDCHVLLVGDAHQLAAVEAGAVFPELTRFCGADFLDAQTAADFHQGTGLEPPEDCASREEPVAAVRLRRVYRFSGSGGIQRLSEAILRGDAAAGWHLLRNTSEERELAYAPLSAGADLQGPLRDVARKEFSPLPRLDDPQEMLHTLGRFRILTALRRGRTGAEWVNLLIESLLRTQNPRLINGPWFHGRAVMVTRNDYQLGLSNGDVGVTAADARGQLRVFFPAAERDQAPRAIAPVRLPPHVPAYALTVHKSQGSEFERVLLLLPGRGNPLLSRELLYTGVTRAKRRVEIWTEREVWEEAVNREEGAGRSAVFFRKN